MMPTGPQQPGTGRLRQILNEKLGGGGGQMGQQSVGQQPGQQTNNPTLKQLLGQPGQEQPRMMGQPGQEQPRMPTMAAQLNRPVQPVPRMQQQQVGHSSAQEKH